MKVLIIDDDSTSNLILEKTLEKTRLFQSITITKTSESALSFLRKGIKNASHLPDLIFLDIYMPDKDGWYFLEEYNKVRSILPKKIKIVVITSSIDKKDRQYSQKYAYVDAFMIKPIELKDLEKLFIKILK